VAVATTPMKALVELRARRRWLRAQGEVLAGDLGELSRLGALRMALSRQSTHPAEIGRRFLVDHSEQKSGGTEEMFGVRLPVVNPFRCFRGVDLRFLVLVSLLCPRRLQRELVAAAVAESLRRQVDDSAETYLWNPYNLVGFALAELLPNVHVYVLAPEYPPVRRAVAVHSSPMVLDIQGVSQEARRSFVRRHKFVSDEMKFVFYPSQAWTLESDDFEESALLTLIDRVREVAEVPLEVRLHYHDLNGPLPTSLVARIGDIVASDATPSLLALSSRQVSFSCHSSIGYELLSLGVAHIILGPQPDGLRAAHSSIELNRWFDTSPSVLPSRSLTKWADQLAAAYPTRATRAGNELVFDGRRIASW